MLWTHFDLGELQFVEYPSQIANLLVELVPYLALRVFQVHGEFVLEPYDLLALHTPSNEGHYHDYVAETERYPCDKETLVEDEQYTAAFRIVLTCGVNLRGRHLLIVFQHEIVNKRSIIRDY